MRALCVDHAAIPGTGRLSRLSHITLSHGDKVSARSPTQACSFAFAYPLEGMRGFIETLGTSGISLDTIKDEPLISFASVGGFV